MHRYYWAAKAVTQLNQILLLNIEERINGSRGRADAADQRALPRPRRHARGGRDDLYLDNPHAILETFLVFQQTPGLQGLSARTLRALYNARNVMDARASGATPSTASCSWRSCASPRASRTPSG
jgi:[protein-PII] uridylyltransferase